MKNALLFVVISLSLVASTGAIAEGGGVAILDVDKVATALNIDKAVLGELQAVEANLNGQLQQRQTELQQQFDKAKTDAGQVPSPEQQAALVSYNKELNGQFNQIRTQAQQLLSNQRIQKINAFREKLAPIALAAAKTKGFQVVMSKTQQVFAYADTVDITAEVIEAAIEAGMEVEIAELPVEEDSATPTE